MPQPQQSSVTFDEISRIIWKHLEERDWHNQPPRSLAISIMLEASELVEHYQWSDKPVGSKQELAAEVADIMIYAFEFAQATDIDIASAIKDKLKKAAIKYPAEEFKGKQSNERKQAWIEAKKNHKKDGL